MSAIRVTDLVYEVPQKRILNGINLTIQKNSSLWQGTIVGSVVILAVLLNVIGRRRQ